MRRCLISLSTREMQIKITVRYHFIAITMATQKKKKKPKVDKAEESGTLMHCAEKAMAPHSSTLAWKIPCTEEPGRLQSMGSLGVGHD